MVEKTDVKKTFILWIICTAVIGIVGVEFHVRNIVEPASENMSSIISLMSIFTWAAAPVAGLVSAMSLTILTSKRHYGENPPPDADHEIRNSPRSAAVWLVVSGLLCLFALVGGFVVLEQENEAVLNTQAIQCDRSTMALEL